LTDAPLPGPVTSSSPRPMSGNLAGRPHQRPGTMDSSSAPKKTGPATFAEMGIQGAKPENDQCVIM
jgi:hypothetical protein